MILILHIRTYKIFTGTPEIYMHKKEVKWVHYIFLTHYTLFKVKE